MYRRQCHFAELNGVQPSQSFRRSLYIRLASSLLLCLPGVAFSQKTIRIPADQPTIQAGINAASNGDTVLVAPNTYTENLNFNGKAIAVTSSGGAAATTLDGGSTGPAVTFTSGETRSAILTGFTIQHGGTPVSTGNPTGSVDNGGVYISNSSPSILGNTFTYNNCWSIRAENSAPLIQGNELNNTQDTLGGCGFGNGAAIYINGNLPSSTNPRIAALIIGNTMEYNLESGNDNATGNGGAGVAVWGGSPTIQNNIIRNNFTIGGTGGAIHIQGGAGIIIQNLIYGNNAGCGGGAIAFNQFAPYSGGIDDYIANNTIVDNIGKSAFTSCPDVAQIYPDPANSGLGGPSAIFVNNILSGDTVYPAITCRQTNSPATEYFQPIFDHNLFINTGGPIFATYCVDVSAKYGNSVADPKFVNPSAGDYHLQIGSPAIDGGNNSALQIIAAITGSQLTQDFGGNTRVVDANGVGYPIIDIGAYEYAPGAVETPPTTIVLTVSPYTGPIPATGPAGPTYTLAADIASTAGIPTGTITFFLDGKSAGAALINSSGVATLTNFNLPPGVHNLIAGYPSQGNFPQSISVVVLVDISQYPTTLSLTSSLNPSTLGQQVTFTVNASSADSAFILAPITLTDTSTNTVLANLTPNSAGAATFPISTLAIGTHPISATYAGDTNHASATAIVTQQVNAAVAANTTTTLISSANPASVGQSVTFTATVASATTGTPTGSVTFTNGSTVLGTQTLTAVNGTSATAAYTTSTLAVGIHPISATYVPSAGFNPSTGSLTETIGLLTSKTVLSATPNPQVASQTVTLTATVTGTGATPTGIVTFFNGTTPIATIAVNGSGQAQTPATFPAGTYTLNATYNGSTTYGPSTSTSISESITPIAIAAADFTITLASPTITIQTQHHTTSSVALTSLNGFSDTLGLTCNNLPAYLTCRLTPSSTPLTANGTATVSLYLDTDSVLGYAHATPPTTGRGTLPIAWALLLAPFGLFVGIAPGPRRRLRRYPHLRLLAVVLAILPLSVALAGCGQIIYPYDTPPSVNPGTYLIPITATGATTGTTHSAQLTLIVTP